MNITRAAIEKNRITLTILIIVLFAGISTYRTMPRAEDPGFIIRVALIMTYFPGASPERVELLVSDKLEKAIKEMPEMDFISSESRTGVSIIYAGVKESYKVMRPIWDKIRRKVNGVIPDLPDGVIGPFVNDEFGDVFGTLITLTGEGYSYADLKDIADDVRNELLLIEEVAKVEIHGTQEEHIFVEYSDARLAELGLSASQLSGILASQNIIIPGGDVTTDREKIVLEPTGSFESVDELKRTLLSIPGRTGLLYLEDVAYVHRGYVDPPASIVTSSGEQALALAVSLREDGNIIVLGERVKETIRHLQGVYPIGVEFDFVSFQPHDVDKKVKDFSASLLQAVGVVLLVMLLFLGFRTGLVVASLVPMAMISSLMVMGFLRIGLDTMSLASLIIALGMLVDNAIVMSESILVQISSGKKAVEAAIESAGELRIPLLISSLTTAAAFLPIYLAESGVGEYCAPLFKVVTITLLCSWLLSLTMIPLLCVKFLKVKGQGNKSHYDSKFYSGYRAFLVTILRHPVMTLIGIVVIFFVSMQGFRFLPNIFFPDNDKPIFTTELELPIGTPIERTFEIVSELERFMKDELLVDTDRTEGIVNWSSYIGAGAPRFVLNYNPEPSNPAYAVIVSNVTSGGAILDSMVKKTDGYITDHFPDVRASVSRLLYGPPPDNPVAIRISGKEPDRLFQIVDEVKARLTSIPGTKGISDDWGMQTKKLVVHINQARAQRAGVTNRDIAISLQAALTGIEITQYREDDKIIPITLRSVAAERSDVGKVETINVYSQASGQSVPLKQVADVEVEWQPAKILRRDQLKTVTVLCNVTPETTPIAVALEMDEWLKDQRLLWGVGYKYELGGEMESSVEANRSIMDKLPIAGLIILLLLVFQFNSFRKPLIIVVTIPLGMIGVVIGLLVLRSYFGFMTLLGIISLAGVVINNAIVLLDRIRIEIEVNGLDAPRAVVEAAQRRLRPILLTTATTIGGLIPLYLGGGPMWESMAITIMFGLAFATVLTLGVVPVLYAVFYKVRFRDMKW